MPVPTVVCLVLAAVAFAVGVVAGVRDERRWKREDAERERALQERAAARAEIAAGRALASGIHGIPERGLFGQPVEHGRRWVN